MKPDTDAAIVVLSGGQDSTTCLYWALEKFKKVHAITFDYGQRHRIEISAAVKIAELANISHEIIQVPNCLVSASPLTSNNELERYENAEQMEKVIGNRVELTFVPMRNTLFLTIAMNRAVALGFRSVVTGICQEDNANYPDCTEKFRRRIESAFNISLGVEYAEDSYYILAPLMDCSKADTVRLMRKLGPSAWEALAWTHTSYDGKYPPTDMNHSNVLRAKGFEEAGEADPLVLRAWQEKLMELPSTHNYDYFRG